MNLLRLAILVGSVTLPGTYAAAAPAELPRLFAIGRNVNGEACTAQANINDPGLYDRAFDRSYALNCGSATASRAVGTVRVLSNSAIAWETVEKTLSCAASQAVMLKGIGKADARMCNDMTLGIRTIALRFMKGSRTYVGNAALSLAGPLENALAIASGVVPLSTDSGALIKPSVDAKALPQLAVGDASGQDDLAFNPRNALQQGIRFNVQGLHAEASRVLNDALSRLPDADTGDLRGELELEAALADSNIGFFESAAAHFKRGEDLLAKDADPVLLRKLGTYRALDELNQRNFPEVVSRLQGLDTGGAGSSMPLSDPVIIAALNQGGAQGNSATTIGASSTSALTQVVINAQINWARSAAMLLMNDVAGAERALAQSRREFAVIASGGVEQTQTRWLEARIERQAGRIAARKRDWTGSLSAFDSSLAALRAAQSLGGAGSGPELIETQLERADILARQGGDQANIIREYASAVDAIMESGLAGKIKPSALEPYLALISGGTTGNSEPEAVERYFRAVQTVGEPAIARQISQLQSVVSVDAGLSAQIRERADLAQELTGLRYQISQRAGGVDIVELEHRRKGLEERFRALDDALASNDKFRTTDDRPATVAEIQSILGEDEIYFKLTTAKSRAFGLVIGKRDSTAYQLATPVDTVMKVSAVVRQSIDGTVGNSRGLRDFKVGASNSLFRMIAGPIPERLASATRIIVDPSGPLQRLPIGVLVVDTENARQFAARGKASTNDYTNVAFLAAHSEISTALSPRSFIAVRAIAPSQAPNPFLGLGSHLTPSSERLASFGYRRTNFGCLFNTANMTDSYQRAHPINREEIVRAATAFGDPGAPEISGAAFNDTDVEARTDLNQYAVLHFATHGLQEGQWADCLKAPPALVTSLGAGNSDGLMSFDEIAALKLDANLVFLSACNTEAGVTDEDLARLSGKEEKGASLEGLVRAFLAAKARAIVATYWEASESEGTNRLIETFYNTGRTQSIGAAMRDGQRQLIADRAYSHPFYWAPYFIVGDAGKSMISPSMAMAQ